MTTDPDALSFQRTATVSGPPAAVFAALVDAAAVEEWMTAEAEIDPRVGGAVTITADGWIEMAGVVTAFDPPALLAFRWDGGLRTELSLADDPVGTRLALHETGFTNPGEIAVRSNLWSHWLIRLSAVVGVRR